MAIVAVTSQYKTRIENIYSNIIFLSTFCVNS